MTPGRPADAKTYKILLIGSSYLGFNDLPELMQELATAAGKSVLIEKDIIYGTYLEDHCDSPITADKIRQAEWDFVILQSGCGEAAYPDTQEIILPPFIPHYLYPALKKLQEMIRQNCPTTQTVYLMPWAFEDGLTWIEGQTDTYSDMQKKIYRNTVVWSAELGLVLAPVGWSWYSVIAEQPQLHYLFLSDFNHPSVRGSYLMACVFHQTLFGESTAGLSCFGGLPESEARYFQDIASATGLDTDHDGIPNLQDSEPYVATGDMNFDMVVDFTDAHLFAEYLVGNSPPNSSADWHPDCADLNRDGCKNVVDLEIYLQSAGKISLHLRGEKSK